ncbi:MAG: hypothetical protein OEZ43_20245 [Gammaproteobacteria bacterium]|nr:hypothetical protein [Gammaproteobacteria bacterium]
MPVCIPVYGEIAPRKRQNNVAKAMALRNFDEVLIPVDNSLTLS